MSASRGSRRVLVVGAGLMGSLHARTLQGSRQGDLCGVADRSETVARQVGDELGVPWYLDVVEAIEASKADTAIIATPDSAHVEPATTAIDAGLDVLVEKPLATTAVDAQAIVDRAEQCGVRLMTGHLGRFHPRYAKVAATVRSGAVGRPESIWRKWRHGEHRQWLRRDDCTAWPELQGRVEGALHTELEHFLDAVVEGTPFAIAPNEAVDAVRSAEALQQAAVRRAIE